MVVCRDLWMSQTVWCASFLPEVEVLVAMSIGRSLLIPSALASQTWISANGHDNRAEFPSAIDASWRDQC